MARIPAFVAGLALGLVIGTAVMVSHADDVSAEVSEAAAAAHVSAQDLQGAVNTTGEDPWTYLRGVGELDSPPSSSPLPRPALPPPAQVVSSRVACIERAESRGLNVPNARGSGAVGVLQFMPSTFAAHAAEMGHFDWSPWNPEQARAVAAHDLALGRRGQWTVGGC